MAAPGEPQVRVRLDHAHALAEGAGQSRRVVGGEVVNDRKLVVIAQLWQQGLQEIRQMVGRLVGDHHDCHCV